MIRGTHRAALWACLVAVGCCWRLPCAAQVATLDWSAPRGCPDAAYVSQRLATTHGEAARNDLRVRARIQRSLARLRGERGGRGTYVLRLVLRARDFYAERRLEASSCASVTDAAIWLINVALAPGERARTDDPETVAAAEPPGTDPDAPASPAARASDLSGSREPTGESLSSSAAARDTQQRAATETAQASASAAAPVEAPTAPRTYPARRAPWRVDWAALPRWWRAGVFGGVWSAGLPAPQVSVGARLGFGISALYAELRAAAELSRGRRLADATVARFATQDVGLAVCAQWGNQLRVGPCATAAVLRTTAGSRSAPEASERVLPWSAAGVALALGFRARRGVEVMLETGVQLPLSARPRFTVEGVGEVAVAAPVNVYARLGLGFRSADIRREQ